MSVAEKPTSYFVQCLPNRADNEGRALLSFSIGEKEYSVKVHIGKLSAKLLTNISDRSIDLLEIAAIVYGVDSAISRGGSGLKKMGEQWYRRFKIELPVRDLEFWQSNEVNKTLEETLAFLSGDQFEFDFVQKQDKAPQPYLDFDEANSWQAERVLMFSGGLDSFAGALEEIAEQGQRVALISHYSANKTAPIQKGLYKALQDKFGENLCRHVPVQIQMLTGSNKEGTHRARSFLFGALGMVTAQALGIDRVSFYENGVVSLNLPPVGNVQSTRATRTTHPQTLAKFTEFFSRVFEKETKVDNPFFLRTKTDVVETIARLKMADQIKNTTSCADVHNQTKQHPHCGRCSQCIDRRFAIIAANLQSYDPEEAYRVDLMSGERKSVTDKEIALSYMRNARAFEVMNFHELMNYFPQVIQTLKYIETPETTSIEQINELLARHGRAVVGAFENELEGRSADDFPENSLVRLYGDEKRNAALPEIAETSTHSQPEAPQTLSIRFNKEKRLVLINEQVEFSKTATADLLIVLSEKWLEGAGEGLELYDYPTVKASTLTVRLGVSSDEVVRRRINRSRNEIVKKFQYNMKSSYQLNELIENLPGYGYRLNPQFVAKVTRDKSD